MTHVHLWHLGHYGTNLEDIEKLGMVEYFFISSNGVGEARELLSSSHQLENEFEATLGYIKLFPSSHRRQIK